MTTTWTTTESAAYCGIKTGRFRSIASLAGIAPVAREPGRAGENLWDADTIRALHASRPGQGARTDLVARGTGD